MRTEIKSVVSTLISLLDDVIQLETAIRLPASGSVSWILRAWKTEHERDDSSINVRAGCYDNVLGNPIYIRNTIAKMNQEVQLQDVRRVHQSLNPFANWILTHYPAALERLQPILDAAVLPM